MLLAALLMACEKPAPPPAGSPAEVGAGTRPAAETQPAEPLAAEALLALDKLQPAVEKPVNPAEVAEIPSSAKREVAEAEALLAQRSYARAIRLLERAGGFAPNHPRILRSLALAYAGLPDAGKALATLQQAARVAPDDLQTQALLARLYEAQNRPDKAMVHYRTALVCSDAAPSNPQTGEVLLSLASVLGREGYWTASLEAINRFEQWLDEHAGEYAARPSLQKYVLQPELLSKERGRLLLLLRRPAEAVQQLDRAYRRNRSDENTAVLLMEALVRAGQFDRAEKMVVEMAVSPSLSEQLSLLTTRLVVSSRDAKMPLRIWQAVQARSTKVNDKLALTLVQAAETLQAPRQAEAIAQAVISEAPGNALIGRYLVGRLLESGKQIEALSLAASILAADPASAGVGRGAARQVAANSPAEFAREFAQEADAAQENRGAMHYVAAALAEESRQDALAVEQYRKAIEAAPPFLPAYEPLMDRHAAERNFREVDRLLDSLGEQAEDSALHHYLRGKFALLRGQLPAAIRSLQQARVRDRKHVGTLLLLAEAYRQAGQINDATQSLQAAVALAPNSPVAVGGLFRLYLAQDRWDLADRLRKEWAERRPDDQMGRLMLAELRLAQNKRDEALELLRALRKEFPDSPEVELLLLRAESQRDVRAMTAEEFDAYVEQLSEVIRKAPKETRGLAMLSSALARRGEPARERAAWKALHESIPNEPAVAMAYAQALLRQEKWADAQRVLQKLLEADPREFRVRQGLLMALEKLEKFDEAQKLLEDWLEAEESLDTKNFYRGRLLDVYEKNQEYEKALKLIDYWIGVTIDENLLLLLRTKRLRMHALAGQYDKAVEAASAWAGEEPQRRSAIRQLLIGVLSLAKQYDRAAGLLDEWIDGQTDGEAIYWRRIKISMFIEADRIDAAEKAAAEWIEADPENLLPKRVLVYSLAGEKKYARARALLAKWMGDLPESRPAEVGEDMRFYLEVSCSMWAMERQWKQLLSAADGALKIDPENVELHSLKAAALDHLGRGEESLAVMEKALRLAPDNPSVNNNLGYQYADKGLHLDRAERMIRKALAASPEQAAFLDSLGWVLYKQGRFAEAVRVFEQVLRREGDEKVSHAVIYDHAGDAHYRLGRVERAVALWKEALELTTKQEPLSAEDQAVAKALPGKISAAEAGKPARVAPLGKGVTTTTRPATRPTDDTEK